MFTHFMFLSRTKKLPGVLLSECGTNCHKKCEKKIPNLCGVNQKILAEAIDTVNRVKSVSSRSSTAPQDGSNRVSALTNTLILTLIINYCCQSNYMTLGDMVKDKWGREWVTPSFNHAVSASVVQCGLVHRMHNSNIGL